MSSELISHRNEKEQILEIGQYNDEIVDYKIRSLYVRKYCIDERGSGLYLHGTGRICEEFQVQDPYVQDLDDVRTFQNSCEGDIWMHENNRNEYEIEGINGRKVQRSKDMKYKSITLNNNREARFNEKVKSKVLISSLARGYATMKKEKEKVQTTSTHTHSSISPLYETQLEVQLEVQLQLEVEIGAVLPDADSAESRSHSEGMGEKHYHGMQLN